MFKTLPLFLSAALLVACGGDDSGDGTTPTPDASAAADGGTTVPDAGGGTPDAMAAAGLGQLCTSAMPFEQGDCPTGFVCAGGLQGVTPFCTKECTQGAAGDMACRDGYAGTNGAACVFGVMMEGGPTTVYCATICEDSTPTTQLCGDATCDGTCSTGLACNGPIMAEGAGEVGKMCL